MAGNDGKPPFGRGRGGTAAKRLLVSPGQRSDPSPTGGDGACERGFPSFPATDRVPLCQTRVDAHPCSAGLESDPSDRVLRRALPQRAGASRGAGARRARRSGPAPPTAAWRGQCASVAKNHRNRKEGGLRPPRPSGKRLVPELPFRPRRAAARESRRRSSDFGDFLPQTAPPPAKPALARTRTRRARAGPPSGRAPRRALSPNDRAIRGVGRTSRGAGAHRARRSGPACANPGLTKSRVSRAEPPMACARLPPSSPVERMAKGGDAVALRGAWARKRWKTKPEANNRCV